jgi:serine/threonine-protein kinase HipA
MMAQKCGLKMMESKLFPSKKNPGYFGTKRFDRDKHGKRIHVQSMSGLLHVDHRLPSLDYEAILKTTLWLTKDMRQVEIQFRHMVFNVFAHNRDDHAKNFSFLMSEEGLWTVSPAYDLTFSYGPGGEHCTALLGEGKKPSSIHLKKLGLLIGINPKKVNTIVEEVCDAVTLWPHFALEAGVSKKTSQLIQTALERIKKD